MNHSQHFETSFKFIPIGYIESVYKDKFGIPRQSNLVPEAWASLRLLPSVQPQFALEGLELFSHVWLIWFFHQNDNKGYRPKVHPPRLEGQARGVFATRSPHRPNALGLSLVRLVSINKDVLHFTGIDLLDGTPVLDIKPYLPSTDSVANAKGGWTDLVESKSLKVSWSELSITQLQRMDPQAARAYSALVEKTLVLDPRSKAHRGVVLDKIHASRIHPFDVHFAFRGEVEIEIIKLVLLA